MECFWWVCSSRQAVRGAQPDPAARHLHPRLPVPPEPPGPAALPPLQPPITWSEMLARRRAGHFLAAFLPYSLLGCFQTLPSLSHMLAKPSCNTQGRNPLAGVAQNAWSSPSPRPMLVHNGHRVSPLCPGRALLLTGLACRPPAPQTAEKSTEELPCVRSTAERFPCASHGGFFKVLLSVLNIFDRQHLCSWHLGSAVWLQSSQLLCHLE